MTLSTNGARWGDKRKVNTMTRLRLAFSVHIIWNYQALPSGFERQRSCCRRRHETAKSCLVAVRSAMAAEAQRRIWISRHNPAHATIKREPHRTASQLRNEKGREGAIAKCPSYHISVIIETIALTRSVITVGLYWVLFPCVFGHYVTSSVIWMRVYMYMEISASVFINRSHCLVI